MATADEILATMAEEAAATDQMAEVCTIDRCTRAVAIPEALRIVGVETDKDVTRRRFRVLCSYRGTNLSTFRIRIHFMNANKEKDIYYVTDAAQDGEYLTFSWVISRKATKYKGRLQFIACMVCDGGTDEEREWNSTLGEFTVLEGLEVELTDGEEEQARDAITQLLAVIDARESEAVAAVSAQGATQVAAVQAAGAKQEASIAAKGAETLATIPDDYATLHNNVAALTKEIDRNTAPPIIPTATGEVVTISDSANRPFAGLRIYGKTTQDGTPTLDAHVELVNAGAGGSIGAYARGKNLLNIGGIVQSEERNGVSLTSLGNGFAAVGTAASNVALKWALDTHIPAGQYVLHARNIGTSATTTLYFADVNGTDMGHLPLSTNYAKHTFTANAAIASLKLYIPSGTTVELRLYPMLTVEDTDTREEYKDGGSVTVSTLNGLAGIEANSDGNYTDTSGKQWLCDEVNFGRVVHVQRVGQKVLDSCAYYDAATNLAYVNLSYYPIRNAHLIGLSNGLVYDSRMFDRMVDGTFYVMTTTDDSWGDYLRAVIKLPAGAATNSAEAAAWLMARNITVLYPLYQPIETALSADEIAAFRAMTSQKPTTTVINDSGAGMAVDYIADTKNYIDQKLAAIAAALLEQ